MGPAVCECLQIQMFVGGHPYLEDGTCQWGAPCLMGCMANVRVCVLSNELSLGWSNWLARRASVGYERVKKDEGEKGEDLGRQDKLDIFSIYYRTIWCPCTVQREQSATAQPPIGLPALCALPPSLCLFNSITPTAPVFSIRAAKLFPAKYRRDPLTHCEA